MLNILFGDFTEDCIRNVTGYFNTMKQKAWFNDPFVKSIIKEVDSSDAIKDEYIESPVFGAMSPDRLSCGCKAVILLRLLWCELLESGERSVHVSDSVVGL